MIQEPPSGSLEHLLAQVCTLRHRRAHGLLEDVGLHRGQPPLLRALWREDGLTHSELAKRMHVRPPTVTRMVQRMERAGFLRRQQDRSDQRISRVYLTEAGRDIQVELYRTEHQLEEEAFTGFTPEERAQLEGSLIRVRENLLKVAGGKPHRRGRRIGNGHGTRATKRPTEMHLVEAIPEPREEG
jgi:DNA-binding MarR family transcriptional regulator